MKKEKIASDYSDPLLQQHQNHHFWMKEAIKEAHLAQIIDEVPIGAVIISPTGEIIGAGHNRRESDHNACAHAEMIAITNAGAKQLGWRLNNCTLYVTLEPCIMCLGAILQSRLKQLIFGAYDFKGGALSHNFLLHNYPHFNHNFTVVGGILGRECGELLTDFFQRKRKMAQAARFERATF